MTMPRTIGAKSASREEIDAALTMAARLQSPTHAADKLGLKPDTVVAWTIRHREAYQAKCTEAQAERDRAREEESQARRSNIRKAARLAAEELPKMLAILAGIAANAEEDRDRTRACEAAARLAEVTDRITRLDEGTPTEHLRSDVRSNDELLDELRRDLAELGVSPEGLGVVQ